MNMIMMRRLCAVDAGFVSANFASGILMWFYKVEF